MQSDFLFKYLVRLGDKFTPTLNLMAKILKNTGIIQSGNMKKMIRMFIVS